MIPQSWHIWRLINWSNFIIELNELYKDPKSYFLVAMIHYWCHYEVHALHISYSVVIVCESWKNSFQTKVIFILNNFWFRNIWLVIHVVLISLVKCELRHFWESSKQVFFDISFVISQLCIFRPTLKDFMVRFGH